MRIDWVPVLRALRGRWVAVPLALLLAYFGWHAVHGQRGLLAWISLSQQLSVARAELADLRAEREALDGRVQGLREDAIEPDLLEEELRKLGYVGEGEVIVLAPERVSPPTAR